MPKKFLTETHPSVAKRIYLPEFGIRSEVNVFIDAENNVHVTGGELQTEVLPILTAYPAQKES